MCIEKLTGSVTESPHNNPSQGPATLLYEHTGTNRYGDTTVNKLWGIVSGAIGVVVETETLKVEATRLLSAHALNLYLAASGTTLRFEAGTRDAQGEAVIKVPNPNVQAGIDNRVIEGDLSEAEQEAVGVVARAYASLAGVEHPLYGRHLGLAA